MHSPRTILLQTLGHFVLGHAIPQDFADFLRQRVEANYFAAAVLVPEQSAARFLLTPSGEGSVGGGSAGRVLGLLRDGGPPVHQPGHPSPGSPCHFVKNDESGVIYKAYENDGLVLPADASGAIEGQRMCRKWSGRQVFSSADRFSPHYQYRTPPRGHSGVWHTWTPDGSVASPSPWASPTSIRAGSAAGTRPQGWLRAARTATAASARLSAWPPGGRAWPGPLPAPTRTSCPRFRPGVSPVWTRRTSTSSSTGTRRTDSRGWRTARSGSRPTVR